MTAVTYVRFVQPFRHLEPLGFELSTLGESLELVRSDDGYEPSPDILDGIGALIFPQMVLSPRLADGSTVNVVKPLCREARRRGVKIVYSADDYLAELDPENPAYDSIQGSIGNLKTILDHADAFIVTTEALRRSFSSLGRPIYILPNAVDPSYWKVRPETAAPPRIGWSGSSSHIDDLLMILPAVRRLQERVSCEFHLHGLTDQPLTRQAKQIRRDRPSFTPAQRETADRFMKLVGELKPVKFRHRPFEGMDTFFDSLSDLDLSIGLCPLVDTAFNRHKSALKSYEYAMVNSLSVASHVPPYVDHVSLTVENEPEAWADMLERYLLDEDAHAIELKRQRELVLGERNIETLCEDWAAALREILG